ncbi:MAG TPA: dTDP-4-dehydrorhamnose reductase [Chitinophagaceae bacterium]|nr:dTDP-4-dehydrorhamnose reductase [Chitinophagaceae bacterium]
MLKKIVITGADGQLGKEIQQLSTSYPGFEFVFTTRQEFPLDNPDNINRFIEEHQPHYFINCAAYTAVDKAESEKETAYKINAEAPGIIANACKKTNARLIHISTDYVFNGLGKEPYKENDTTDPVNFYGATKLEGEKRVMQFNPESIIIRTAWVYSVFGNNFVKTMLRLMKERDQINVVNDQVGTPTYAADLAEVILHIISSGNWKTGIYHFSNEGKISWYDFAVAIKEFSGSSCKVNPITTAAYPTPARRPYYSVLDKTKIRQTFLIPIKDWKSSLSVFMERFKNQR